MNRLGMKEKIGIVSWKKLWLQFLNEYDHEIQSNVVLNSVSYLLTSWLIIN